MKRVKISECIRKRILSALLVMAIALTVCTACEKSTMPEEAGYNASDAIASAFGLEELIKVKIETDGVPSLLSAGEQVQGTVRIIPENRAVELEWSSSDESIASVRDGVITAHMGGTAEITVQDRLSGSSCTVCIEIQDDYLENTGKAIEHMTVSYTDAEALDKLRHQQEVLGRCTSPEAQEVYEAFSSYLTFAEGGEKCDLSHVSEVLGIDRKTLRFAAECINSACQVSGSSVTMSFTGDCTFGYMDDDNSADRFPAVYRKAGSVTYPFDRVRHIFETDDITVINYEATLAEAGSKKADKKYHFRGEASYVNILTGSSVEVANQANNHSLDYLEEGRARTEKLLTEAGVAVLNEKTPVIMEVNGIEVVFIGAGHWKYPQRIEGPANAMHKQIKQYKRDDNIVIVNLHWGDEYSVRPDREQIEEAHKMIDEGADMIVCHHAHILQGIEVYKGKVIAYGLGNFAYGGRVELHEKETFILRATFTEDNGKAKMKEWSVVPCYISSTGTKHNNYQPMTLYGSDAKKVISLIEKRSRLINGCTDIPYFYCD